MKSPAVVHALVVAVAGICCVGCQPEQIEELPPPAASGPALLFGPLPDAFRLPDDDVDADTGGLQVEVVVTVENQDVDDPIARVTLLSAGGASDEADVADDEDGAGQAVLIATLDVAELSGADNELVARGGGLEVRRAVVGLDRRVPTTPPPPTCALDVAVDGDATVTCSGGDLESSAVQNLVRGGLVSLRTQLADDVDGENARVQQAELRAGTASFDFPFAVDGSYVFSMTLVGAPRVVGAAVVTTVTAVVDVP